MNVMKRTTERISVWLTPEQIEYLAEIGTQLTFARGDVVFEHGQRETPLYVVQSGAIDIIDHAPEGDRYFTQCRAGTFAADISMFTGEPTLAAGYAAEPTSLVRSRRRMCAGSSRPRPSWATCSCGRWSPAESGFRAAVWVSSG